MMKKNVRVKKYIPAIFFVLLLLGTILIPGINAEIANNSEFIEITTSFNGLEGGKQHSVKLTKDEHNRLNIIFDEINLKLKNAKSMEEAKSIFNDAILQLDELNLIPEKLGVKKTQELVTGKFLNSNKLNKYLLNTIKSETETNDTESNRLCLIAGESTEEYPITWFHSFRFRFIYTLAIFKLLLGYRLNRPALMDRAAVRIIILSLIFYLRLYVYPLNSQYSNIFIDPFFQLPIMMGGWINYGIRLGDVYSPSQGWVTSYGRDGLKNWSGNLYGQLINLLNFPVVLWPGIVSFVGVSGFFGLMFDYLHPDPEVIYPRKYIGFSLKVKLGNEPPLPL
ncbi:MAG: hypothetical protein R6V50_06850 [Thermoplasmatota archaeon]